MLGRLELHRLSTRTAATAAIVLCSLCPAHLIPDALAAEAVTLSGGGTLTFNTVAGTTQVDIQVKGERQSIRIVRDSRVAPAAKPVRVKLIGEIAEWAAILVDTYPSVA